MAGQHHQFNGHDCEQTLGYGEGQRPGLLQSMELQRVRHNLATKQQQHAVSCVCLSHEVMSNSFATPWTVVCQAPLSMGFFQAIKCTSIILNFFPHFFLKNYKAQNTQLHCIALSQLVFPLRMRNLSEHPKACVPLVLGLGKLSIPLNFNLFLNQRRRITSGLGSTFNYQLVWSQGDGAASKTSFDRDMPHCQEARGALPLQVKHLMWKCLVWTRSTSPLHGSPHLWQ